MVKVKNFYQILEDVLEYEGYHLLMEGEGKLVAESDEGIRNLIIAGAKVTEREFKNLKESEGERILVLFEEPDEDLWHKLPEDVKIWGREELIRRIGEMTFEKSLFEGATEGREGLFGPENAVDFELRHDHKESTLKPIVSFDDVTELGEKLVKGFRYRLEVVPHYRFKYKVKLPSNKEESGELYLNGISGFVHFWNLPFERVSDIKRTHFKLEPKINQEDSAPRAMRGLLKELGDLDEYSEKKPERWEEDGAIIVERVDTTPSEEDIELIFREMVYVPMWAVEGTEGIAIVNAATGKVERTESVFSNGDIPGGH